MIVKFDDIEISQQHVMACKQTSKLFENDNAFKLGATLCIAVEIDINKLALDYAPKYPNKITLWDNGAKFLTLYVDSVEEKNDKYLTYHLYDSMLKFNAHVSWQSLSNPSAQAILNLMCLQVLKTQAPTISYLGDMMVTYSEDITARQFIAYVAEVNGSYARINENDELEFIAFNRPIAQEIQASTCKDIKLGDKHIIDRVSLEMGSASIHHPQESLFDTLYLDSDNPLISDSSGYSRDNIVSHIYDSINGFTFFNFTTSKCQFNTSIQCGDLICFVFTSEILQTQGGQDLLTQLGEPIEINTLSIPTIANFEWTYNTKWLGGFDLSVTTSKQEETKFISNAEKKINKLNITVDREVGKISQSIETLNGDVSDLSQTSSNIQATFVKKSDKEYADLTTNIKFDIEGVNITSSNVDTNLQLSSGGVYIRDNNNQSITSMEKNQFSTGEWVLSQTSNSINFYRRH